MKILSIILSALLVSGVFATAQETNKPQKPTVTEVQKDSRPHGEFRGGPRNEQKGGPRGEFRGQQRNGQRGPGMRQGNNQCPKCQKYMKNKHFRGGKRN